MNPATTPELGAGPVATLLAVLAVAVVAAGALWALKRAGIGQGRDGAIRLVGTRSLGGRRAVALVEVEGERFLLGVTEQSVSCLGRIGDDGERLLVYPADERGAATASAERAAGAAA